MKRIRHGGLYICIWLVLVVSALARAAAVDGAAGAVSIVLFWAAVHGAGLWFAYSSAEPASKKTTEAIAAIGIAAFLLELLLAGLVQGLMSLLLWLAAAKNPSLTTRRDAYFALAISLALVAFGASEARSTLFVLVLIAYGLSALGVLAYCHQQNGFDRESLDIHDMAVARTLSWGHLAALGTAAFGLALLWYLLVPRPPAMHVSAVATAGGQKQSREDWVRQARNGASDAMRETEQEEQGEQAGRGKRDEGQRDEMDITHSAHDRKRSGKGLDGIVMYVQADRMLYLRRRSFDHFENDRWSDGGRGTRKLLPENRSFTLSDAGQGQRIEYIVQAAAPLTDALPLAAHAVALQAPAEVIARSRDGSVYLPAPIEAGFRYKAVSLLPADGGRPVAFGEHADPARYLQVPEGFPKRIGELARQITAQASTPLEKALALEAHLRTQYAYSLDTVFTSQNVTPVEDFLFVTRRGHCEFFASAMAMMLREAGVPSRVVHGWLAHSYNPVTGLYEVRALDGHAWVEAWIDGAGWTTFEPTAAYPMPQGRVQGGTALEDLDAYAAKLAQQQELQGERSVIQTLSAILKTLADSWHALQLLVHIWFEALIAWLSRNALVAGIVTATGILVMWTLWRMRARLLWYWGMAAVRTTPPARLPIVAFRHVERIARSRRLGRAADETVEEYLARLARVCAGKESECRVLGRAFNLVRYGGKTIDEKQAGTVSRAFHAIAAAVMSY